MKARVKETGEIVDVVQYANTDLYCATNGNEYLINKLDFSVDQTDWNDIRIKASIAAMQGTITILGSSDRYAFSEIIAEGFTGEKHTYPNEIAEFAVACADSLIEKLKKDKNDN